MEFLLSELHNLIISYLKDTKEIDTFITSFNINLTNKDWLHIFSLRYPKFYKNNIINYNVKEIYYGFIQNKVNSQIDIIENNDLMPDSMFFVNRYNIFVRYLIKNNLIKFKYNLQIIIYALNDVELFLQFNTIKDFKNKMYGSVYCL